MQLASGVISNLTVNDERRSIVFESNLSGAAKGVGIAAAAAGMAAEAAQVSSVGDTEEEIEVYQFEINGAWFKGYTRAVEFQDGDFLEVVYRPADPMNEALAVRRPATRNIWVQHFMSKGIWAGVFYVIKVWIMISVAVALLVGGFIFVGEVFLGGLGRGLDFLLGDAAYFPPMFGAILLIGAPVFAPRYYRLAREATEIFRAFGFDSPKWVDLDKTSKPRRMKWAAPAGMSEEERRATFWKRHIAHKRNNFQCWY